MTVLAGVDLGGTKVQAVVLRDGERLGQARVATPAEGSNEEIASACADAATGAVRASIGIGSTEEHVDRLIAALRSITAG